MDRPSITAAVKWLAPRVPRILGDATTHSLGLSKTSSKWDLKSALIMSVVRSVMNDPPSPIGVQQKQSLKDRGIKGPLWVSKQTFPAPEDGASDLVEQIDAAVNAMAPGDAEKAYTKADVKPVEVEWTGWRADAEKEAPRPDVSEDEQYRKLMASVTSDVTVLYMHGGALYLLDPCTHRTTVARIAKHSGGRCASVRYRLAPQNPFPAALLDCLVAYLTLLHPPPGAIHDAVPAKNIVFAGDSAGGTLSLTLLQLILQLHRANNGSVPNVKFHGRSVPLPLPAGVAMQSPWADLCRCLPSIWTNQPWDYLPPPIDDYSKSWTPDDYWPTTPPRGDLYCETAMFSHPLINPIMTTTEHWKGAPPVFISVGQETLTDEGKVMARRITAAGSKVRFVEFEAMPHVFPAVFADAKVTSVAFEMWGGAVREMVEKGGEGFEGRGTWVAAKSLKEVGVDVPGLLVGELDDEEVVRRVKEAQNKRGQHGASGDEKVLARL